MSGPIIKVSGLGKRYIISHEGKESYTALRDVITKKARGLFSKRDSSVSSEEFWALKDLNFEVERGQALGIIGRNGAGKSTLLKILSRISEPTTGRIEINGRVASLLEVGTGFHPELTGRENVFLNGAILGMSRAEIKRKFDEIIDFSGVEKFLDTPVKRYSSGMYVRLAFAVAAHLEPEILVVDEVLAVGDAEFQKKCLGKMNDVSAKEGRTVLFVSHDINAITQLCSSSILLNAGTVEIMGSTPKVVEKYFQGQKKEGAFSLKRESHQSMYFQQIRVVDDLGNPKSQFLYNETINFRFEIGVNEENRKANVFILILDDKKKRIFACESAMVDNQMTLQIQPEMLVRGDYSISAHINIPNVGFLDVIEDVCQFTVVDSGSIMAKHGSWDYGLVFGKYTWRTSNVVSN